MYLLDCWTKSPWLQDANVGSSGLRQQAKTSTIIELWQLFGFLWILHFLPSQWGYIVIFVHNHPSKRSPFFCRSKHQCWMSSCPAWRSSKLPADQRVSLSVRVQKSLFNLGGLFDTCIFKLFLQCLVIMMSTYPQHVGTHGADFNYLFLNLFWIGQFYWSRTWACDFRVTMSVLYQLSYLALCWRSPYFVSIFAQGCQSEASQRVTAV